MVGGTSTEYFVNSWVIGKREIVLPCWHSLCHYVFCFRPWSFVTAEASLQKKTGAFHSREPLLPWKPSRSGMRFGRGLQPEFRRRYDWDYVFGCCGCNGADLFSHEGEWNRRDSWPKKVLVFEDDSSSTGLGFGTSHGGLLELPEHLDQANSCSNLQSMRLVGDLELASDASNCL